MIQELFFTLNISNQEILRYYEGNAQNLIVNLNDGRRVQLPLINFRPYINDLGLNGKFIVKFNEENKLIDLVYLG